MKRQSGLSLISTLIVGAMGMAVLILGFKMVPVFTEYFAVKKAFAAVVANTDPTAPAGEFRRAFSKYAMVDDITSIDQQSISVTKENGKAIMEVTYRRELHLFANVGLVFDFSPSSSGN